MSVAAATDVSLLASYRTDSRILSDHPCNVLVEGAVHATDAIRARALRHLHELIAALDRRVPHIEGAGEIAIAHDATTFRRQALDRIA
jgi:hypothetical protein